MKIITRAELETILTFADAISAVRDGLIQVAKGAVSQPAPMQILFHDTAQALAGDCHVKAAQADDLPFFVIKLATGFYDNPALGLDVNNGMVLVLSAHTGHPIALLQDEGWLTQMRTAAAGALAAGLVPLAPDHVLGIIGTGTQALFQAQAIRAHTGLSTIRLLGRNAGSTSACADRLAALGFTVDVAATARDLCAASDVVVTVTPSTEPLIHATDLPAHKLHIVAVGADSPGKIEVAAEVVAAADIIVTDNHAQCLDHGDFGHAVRAGLVAETADIELPDVIAGTHAEIDFASAHLSLVDLTGLGAEDLAIAAPIYTHIMGAAE